MTMFWLAKKTIQEGPFTQQEAREKIKQGDYQLHHLVWVVGTPAWCLLSEVPLLTQACDTVNPSPDASAFDRPPPLPGHPAQPKRSGSHSHDVSPAPWRRYAARALDLALLNAFLEQAIVSDAGIFSVRSIVSGLLLMVLQIPIETFCLEYFQTTVGKAFFGISVVRRDGRPLTRKQSFERVIRVFTFGYAFNLPTASWVSNFLAYLDVRAPHGASWDRAVQSVVWYEKDTALRQFVGSLLLLFLDTTMVARHVFGLF